MKFLKALGWQLLLLVPLFWLIELAQNQAYRLVLGDYGWHYPQSPHHWFSFLSLPSWGIAITAMALVERHGARPGQWREAWACLVAGSVCWALEWGNGWFHAEVLGAPLYVWPFSPLRYVGPEALLWWWGNAWLYRRLAPVVSPQRRCASCGADVGQLRA